MWWFVRLPNAGPAIAGIRKLLDCCLNPGTRAAGTKRVFASAVALLEDLPA